MNRVVVTKEASEPVETVPESLPETGRGSFARGMLIALPAALAIWAVVFWLF
ncbi:hypothetical protein [Erythrobacter sp. THAF29]|uniref:hypothetical protein n=1 Tax=Erythrobacter sp. THAF29 TaxID=2587851 RepID=UPI001562D38E|nr:hypothetical protein [Erythrobacter sp. THAF29]